MENKIITALRFASDGLTNIERKLKPLIQKEQLTSEESLELAQLATQRAKIAKSCGVNDLFEISEAVDNIIKNYGGMRRRGKKQFTVRLVIHETYEDS